VHNAVVK